MSVLPLREPRFAGLPDVCYRHVPPQPLAGRVFWVHTNPHLTADFRLPEQWADGEALAVLSGSRSHETVQPLASVYSGHQFGVWAGQLGDGRALLLGDAADTDNRLQEWQLKGAGKTSFSRFADGRAVLRSSIREYLCSEAMHALGIPTTRALALVGSDAAVFREQPETAAVLTRTAPTFVRFGHFEHFYRRGDKQTVQALADWLIQNHFADCIADGNKPYEALFAEICRRTAHLAANWQALGFCHGVLNTDNMSVLGLTIDYGPFGFLEEYNRYYVCNHSDREGRYAYYRQPYAVHWNLSRLAVCFSDWVDMERLQEMVDEFVPLFQAAFAAKMIQKLGLTQAAADDDALIRDLDAALQSVQVDYTLFMRALADLSPVHQAPLPAALSALLAGKDMSVMNGWLAQYRRRLRQENRQQPEKSQAMNRINPLYIPRNYLLQQVITQAQQGQFDEIDRLFNCWQNPFVEQTRFADLALPPADWQKDIVVSCSS